MNTAEDIKRMLGELVDEAIRIGKAKGEKTLGTDAQLKEQVKRLTDDKRRLSQKLDHAIDENNDLELMIGRLRATLEKAEDEKTALRGQLDGYERTSTEASKEIDRLTSQVRRYEEQLNMLHEMRQKLEDENNDLREQLDKLAAENDELEEANRKFAFDIVELDTKIKEQAEALAIYRVPTPRACPFCGGLAEVHQLRKGEWYVACGNGDCPVNPETSCFDTEADAIEAWNNSYNTPKVTCDWR